MSQAIESIKELVSKYTIARNEFLENGQTLIKEVFTSFFNETPDIKLIAWTQYTPYFNDGEECIFEINDPFYSLKDVDVSTLGDPYELEDDEYTTPSNKKAEKEFLTFWKAIKPLQTILREMFGEHSVIYASKKGFTVETYDHE